MSPKGNVDGKAWFIVALGSITFVVAFFYIFGSNIGFTQAFSRLISSAENQQQVALLPAVYPNNAKFTSVSTYQAVSLYWRPAGMSANVPAKVRFKEKGTDTWYNGHDLYFDTAEGSVTTNVPSNIAKNPSTSPVRPTEYRGSIVYLEPGTTYTVELKLGTNGTPEYYDVTTWDDNFKIKEVRTIGSSNSPLEINNVHGSAEEGYIVYDGRGTAVIDVQRKAAHGIRIQNSSYVIVRGFTVKGATRDGIILGPAGNSNNDTSHDIVIENNDISGWGSIWSGAPSGTIWGNDFESGIRSESKNLTRVTIQRNKIHHPYTNSNNWTQTTTLKGFSTKHPYGPQGISLMAGTVGNFVIRYNEIYSDDEHRYNDGMGDYRNFHNNMGFPLADSDIYGNYVTHAWDDAMEIEGMNMNVRVFENYVNKSYVGIAISSVAVGPFYMYRNVFGGNSAKAPGYCYGGQGVKRGYDDGRAYLYNNTFLYPSGGCPSFTNGFGNRNDSYAAYNHISRNNIIEIRRDSWDNAINDKRSSAGNYDHDMYNGALYVASGQEKNGIKFTHDSGAPQYVGSMDENTKVANIALKSSSNGYDDGVVIPNFADRYNGSAPDMGAQEAGTPAMRFGVNAGGGSYVSAPWNPSDDQIPATTTVVSAFAAGDRVKATDSVNARSLASILGLVTGIAFKDLIGTIGSEAPVSMDSYIWSYVTFDNGLRGWVVESYLAKHADAPTTPTTTPEIPEEPQEPEPTNADPFLVNAGSALNTEGNSNKVWSADYGFADGRTTNRGSISISNTTNDHLYQTERYEVTKYNIPISNSGTYEVKLHFAETYSGVSGSGQRVFSVNVEGTAINNLDVYKEAGGRNRALVKTLKDIIITDGSLTITFTESKLDTMINAIEIKKISNNTTVETPEPPTQIDNSFKKNDNVELIETTKVRSSASLSASVRGTRPAGIKGTVVDWTNPVVKDGYTWYRVDFAAGSGYTSIGGWVASVTLKLSSGSTSSDSDSDSTPSTTTFAKNSIVETTKTTEIRASASNSGSVRGTRDAGFKGTVVDWTNSVVADGETWYRVDFVASGTYNAIGGWVKGSALKASSGLNSTSSSSSSSSFDKNDRVELTKTATIMSEGTTSSTARGTRTAGFKGTVVDWTNPVTADGYTWYRVDFDAADGYNFIGGWVPGSSLKEI